jgi:hypothetical protein
MHIEIINKDLQELVSQFLEHFCHCFSECDVTFLRLKGIFVQSYKPILVMSAIFLKSFGAIWMCQKPDCKSNAVN